MLDTSQIRSYSQNFNSRTKSIKSCQPWRRIKMSDSDQLSKKNRLSTYQIRQITRSLIKDKKAHQNNVGVLTNVKGKMYCLKLGKIHGFKQFSHYFYASHYRRQQQRTNSDYNSSLVSESSNRKSTNKKMRNIQQLIQQKPYDDGVFNQQTYNQQQLTQKIKNHFVRRPFINKFNKNIETLEQQFPYEDEYQQFGNTPLKNIQNQIKKQAKPFASNYIYKKYRTSKKPTKKYQNENNLRNYIVNSDNKF